MSTPPAPYHIAPPVRCGGVTPLRGLPVAVIDVETTGLDPDSHDIVSLAVVHLELGQDNARIVYSSMFHPVGGHLADATAVHGLTDAETHGCPSVCSGFTPGHLWMWWNGHIRSAYNAHFDGAFLGLDAVGMLDPQVWVQGIMGGRRRSLRDVARSMGIAHRPHNAASDALATAHVMERLWDRLPTGSVEETLIWQGKVRRG